MIEPPVLWDGVLRRLRVELPAFAVEAWADPLVAEADPQGIRLLCPSPFHRDRVARYLEDTAGTFHRFYDQDDLRVLPKGDEDPTDAQRARLVLIRATRTVFENALGLLGVSAPERM